jgi:hypothetical protein
MRVAATARGHKLFALAKRGTLRAKSPSAMPGGLFPAGGMKFYFHIAARMSIQPHVGREHVAARQRPKRLPVFGIRSQSHFPRSAWVRTREAPVMRQGPHHEVPSKQEPRWGIGRRCGIEPFAPATMPCSGQIGFYKGMATSVSK